MNTLKVYEPEMIINPNTRKIYIPKELYNIAVVFDNNAEVVRLKIPRYFDGCDFSTKQCTINYKNALGEQFGYPVEEKEIFEDSLLLYWYISDSVTKKEGKIYFNVEFEISMDERGKSYHWSTLAAELNVLPSLGNGSIETEDLSLYQQLLAKMHNHNNKDILDSITSNLINKIHEAVSHIGDVLRHIPSGGSSGQVVGKDSEGNIAWVDGCVDITEIPTNISAFNNDVGYVISEKGKGLSSNDFTDEEKTKLALLTVDTNPTFILCNKSVLTFSNKTCTIKDDRITENSLADVYFTADSISIAASADISADTYDGYLTLSAENEPIDTIQATILIKVV